MRRKDREMSEEFALSIIDKSRYGVLSMVDADDAPYGLPLSMVRDERALYFHSAMDGKKVRVLANNQKVNATFVGEVHVPDNYTKQQLDEIAADESKAVTFISSVFTTEFESAIVTGTASKVEDETEKIHAMRLICQKYTPDKMQYFDIAIKAGLNRANVYKVSIDEITGKRKKYDSKGKEMKFGRME